MKKRIIIVIAVLAVAAFSLLTGCSYDYSSAEIKTSESFNPETFTAVLDDFVKNHPDRTSFSSAEKAAADYLDGKLVSYGVDKTERQALTYDYSYGGSIMSVAPTLQQTFESQNVIGRINGKNAAPDAKKVVIGANYDNLYAYSGLYEGYYRVNNLTYTGASGGMKAEAALGATGAATALVLAEKLVAYNNETGLDFNVEIVFFGAEQFGCRGSIEYTSSARKNDAILYINLARIGGDNIYAYFDEVDTAHGELFTGTASALGYGEIISVPSSLQTTLAASSTSNKLPYTNYALMGSAGVFFGEGVKIAGFSTGVWDSFVLSDKESLSYNNISDTSSDTLKMLTDVCPHYATQMAVVGDTVFSSVTDSGLIASLGQDAYDYTWLTFPLAAALTVIGLILVVAVVLVLFVKHFEKKYPYIAPKPKKVKMAVFGMDYENKDDADIFIDAKFEQGPLSHDKKPFDPFDDTPSPDIGADDPENESNDKKED